MRTDTVSATQPTRRGLVVALHCSGAGASQWRRLGAELGGDYELVAPEHYGCENIGAWTGEHAFTLADEAARTIALIDSCDRKVHLVGHSYGGGLRSTSRSSDRTVSQVWRFMSRPPFTFST